MSKHFPEIRPAAVVAVSTAGVPTANSACQGCGKPLRDAGRFKPRRFCSDACRKRLARQPRGPVNGHGGGPSGVPHEIPVVLEKTSAKLNDLDVRFLPRRGKNRKPSQTKTGIWQRLNDVTWKLYGTEQVRTAAIGQTSGFLSPIALAWAIQVGGAWYAGVRQGAPQDDLWFGPLSFGHVKGAAEALLRGAPLMPQGEARLIRGRLPINKMEARHIDRCAATIGSQAEPENETVTAG